LVYAGGVALNCVSNSSLEREGPFDSLFVPGAAHDAGTAVGAALAVAHEDDGLRHEPMRMGPRARSPFLGLSYDHPAIDAAIFRSGVVAEIVANPAITAASLVADGQVVGWFQGRDEFGPRALGGRSLLADPRRAEMRAALNQRIKHRESFRPFGASVLAEDAADWFLIPGDRPGAACCRQFMILAYPVRPARADLIPAVLHHDGTCRLQFVDAQTAPLFHRLITRFRELTGVPMVLNTSFNDREPLVATPDDALKTFSQTHIDALFLGDRLVRQTG
jgi:carbamoyltransferase